MMSARGATEPFPLSQCTSRGRKKPRAADVDAFRMSFNRQLEMGIEATTSDWRTREEVEDPSGRGELARLATAQQPFKRFRQTAVRLDWRLGETAFRRLFRT